MSAHAKIGETRAQLVHRFGPITAIQGRDGQLLEWDATNTAMILLDNTGRSAVEWYYMRSPYSASDANEIVKTVLGGVHWRWTQVNAEMQRSTDGRYAIALFTADPPLGYSWGIEVGYARSIEAFNAPPAATPPPWELVYPSQTVAPPNDCAIIAAEAYKRLKPVTYWCEIMGVRAETPAELVRHAMVFYKYQADGNVIVYDARGSIELNTTSEKLEDLAKAIKPSIYSLVYSYPTKVELNPLTYDEAKSYRQSVTKTAGTTNKPLNDLAEAIGYVAGWIIMKLLIGGGIGYLIGKSKNMPWFGFWWGFALGLVGWIVTVCMRVKRPIPA